MLKRNVKSRKIGNPSSTTSAPRRRRQRKRSKSSSAENTVAMFVGALLFIIGGAFLFQFARVHHEQSNQTAFTNADVDSSGVRGGEARSDNVKSGAVNIANPSAALNVAKGSSQEQKISSQEQKVSTPVQNVSGNENQPPHLYPPVPYLPIFSAIPNADALIEDTLAGVPTIAGITALLQKFLADFHVSNMELSAKSAQGPEIISTLFELIKRHLSPFDRAYRDKPIFPIREDESIFLSLAAFREHLLADTLVYAFDNAKHPEKLFVGAVVQNCFGKVNDDGTIDPSGKPCKTGAQVIGKNKAGRDMTKVSDAPIDKNGVADFCKRPKYKKYCDAGQIRAVYVHETESLGPAMARYYASKLWGGETYFIQTDSHLQFAVDWDEKYKLEAKAAHSFPKVILSSYPPGFSPGNGNTVRESPGARLCHCSTNALDPNPIIRINTGVGYRVDEPTPTQIPFVAAGFFFARAEFLIDVPFDPFLPWVFMGEEIALSLRAWTHGWNIYAPRKNLIAHQYRPGRMGLPKFWGSVSRLYGRPGLNNRLQKPVIQRVKHLAGYPGATLEQIKHDDQEFVLEDFEHYSTGDIRTSEQYMQFAGIFVDEKNDALDCRPIDWCNKGTQT